MTTCDNNHKKCNQPILSGYFGEKAASKSNFHEDLFHRIVIRISRISAFYALFLILSSYLRRIAVKTITTDIAVIGAGGAGLRAAIAAAE
ncbi:hypothetical protein AB6E21_23245, partial [Photobacterium swingsii]|uniref:hypothetical protein n=1 Tax=Photobacterium swingsii TaxID=680026 RepID=UPI00355407B6